MVSMLECIERIPALLEQILENRAANFRPLLHSLEGKQESLEEIVFVGSGTSGTTATTSRILVEKASGLKTSVCFPNDFCHNTAVYNPNALYVFTSQTGGSIVARQAQQKMVKLGYPTVAITESTETPMATEAPVHVDMGCGREEYPMRTIGYSTSVFTQMLLGLEVGKARGAVSAAEYDRYIAMAAAVPASHRKITPRAMQWMDKVKRGMLRSTGIFFYGADALQGVAQEAAMKVWEIPQIASTGYELEEGLHGPNYGFNHNHCVVVLNHGGREKDKALGLARWMKDVYNNGFVIGSPVADESDFAIELVGGDFDCLEITPVVQILAYRLAEDGGRDLYAPHDNSVMESYFKTHLEDPAKNMGQ